MFPRILSLIADGARNVREQPQLLLTLALILVIPFAFWYTADQFREAGRANQTKLEHDRIGTLQDIFVSLIHATAADIELIQTEIERIGELNPDITKFRLSKEVDGEIIPLAALHEGSIGVPEESDAYRLAYTHKDEGLIFEYFNGDSRFEQAVRLVEVGDETYFILTEVSKVQVDALFAAREFNASVTLFVVLAIVMVLVMRHVFIVNYGYLYREAKQAIETKDMFTNMIAHELRAPLTAIRGYASIISEQKHIDEDTRGEAKRIEESSERLITIVSDLLDVARIQSGKLSIKNEKIDLSEVITTVLDSLQPSAAKKRITLKSEGTNGTLTITNDGKRLYQALTNLVSNAIKYTESGSITVSVEKKRDRVELRVKDTGMGIDAESQKELFAPFFRVKNEKVDIITGTGLGMWITKQLVALMGGSIGVESIKEVGTHVVITLPFK